MFFRTLAPSMVVFALLAASAPLTAAPARPNIVIVLVDDKY